MAGLAGMLAGSLACLLRPDATDLEVTPEALGDGLGSAGSAPQIIHHCTAGMPRAMVSALRQPANGSAGW